MNYFQVFSVKYLILPICFFFAVKVCAIQDLVAKSQCDILESEGVATCVPVVDSVDCALKIKNGKANVASFNAEQALVVAKYLDSTVSVVGSTRHKDKKYGKK